jgi:hypothetical protein
MHVTEQACYCHFHPQEENSSNFSSLLSVGNGLSLECSVTGIEAYTTNNTLKHEYVSL